MSRILLCYANAPNTQPLDSLREEYEGVQEALIDREKQSSIVVKSEQHATSELIVNNLEAFKSDLAIFVYSGHAGPNRLDLEDQQANARGIAMLLGECAKSALKMVLLNGCATGAQAATLLDAGVPVVIATSAPVGDKSAARFSIAFFESLSWDCETLLGAFKAGLRAAQTVSKETLPDAETARGAGFAKSDAALWHFCFKEENRAFAENWKLPEPAAPPCPCNEVMIRALGGIYNRNERLRGANLPQEQWYKAALENLPFPVSEPLRKLLASKTKDQEASKFYDTASWNRFELLLYAYQSILQLSAFALLADVWDFYGKTEPPLPAQNEALAQSIKNHLLQGGAAYKNSSQFALLQLLLAWRPNAKWTPYIKESSILTAKLAEPDTLVCIQDLEKKLAERDALRRRYSTAAALCDLCMETEKSLAKVLFAFDFLSNYGLTSIKEIGVLKSRHQKKASFRHRVVKLQISYAELNEEDYKTEQYLENSSIVLHRHGSLNNGVLNLTPFYIDKNALIRAPKAALHHLVGMDRDSGTLFYLPVSRHFEPWPVSPPKTAQTDEFGLPIASAEVEHYTLLKEQFDAFATQLFQKTINAL